MGDEPSTIVGRIRSLGRRQSTVRYNTKGDKEAAKKREHEEAVKEYLTSDFVFRVKADTNFKLSNTDQLLRRREATGGRCRMPQMRSRQKPQLMQRYLPLEGVKQADYQGHRIYSGTFSADGNTFVAALQDRRIRVYDSSEASLKHLKDIEAKEFRWTITDTDISHDGRHLLYSSICNTVYMCNLSSYDKTRHEALDMSSPGDMGYRVHFGIWSARFSDDAREIVAGSSDSAIYVYDVERKQPILRLNAHTDDINSVAWADRSSHIIYSASDDALCKVWDRRMLGSSMKPAGVLPGHQHGLTFVSSRGDGRYLVTNSKDQTLKLWDIRKMMDSDFVDKHPVPKLFQDFDYRWMEYPGLAAERKGHVLPKHPHDCSVQTFRGHSVHQTLIRCYFSPLSMTGQRYIVSGSHDGYIYLYDVLGDPKKPIRLVHNSPEEREPVRDVAWHPERPWLVSVGWDGAIMSRDQCSSSLLNREGTMDSPGREYGQVKTEFHPRMSDVL
mmetsp:Transcript_29491/g.47606  ORF Transcript_29491/g.47606 Transcript_29491/m.47606 type:complete len:499 (-) Transcript_29491:43-1539(-)